MKTSFTVYSLSSLGRSLCIAVLMLASGIALIACGESVVPADAETVTTTGDTAEPAYQVVAFATEDGLTLSGRLYGDGQRAVLLSHMYPTDQTSWDKEAARLAEEGYMALTYDFRGYGLSEGGRDISLLVRDVQAAVKFLQESGAQEIVLVGASMGGTASLAAAAQLQSLSSVRLAGVATFSAPVEFQGLSARQATADIQIAMMFVAAEDDVGAEGARQLQSLSGDRAELHILPGDDHGTDLFAGTQGTTAWQLLIDFVRLCMPVGG